MTNEEYGVVMQLKFPSWTRVVPAVKDAITRFPLPVLCTLGASLALILLIHHIYPVDKVVLGKFFAIMLYGVVSLTSLKLFIESQKASQFLHAMGAVLVMSAITLLVLFVFEDRKSIEYFLFSVPLGLSVLFAPYLWRSSDAPSVWYFNYQTGVAVFFAGIATTMLGVGVSLSMVSIRYLFEFDIPTELYGDVWVLSWGIFFPIYVLANIARKFEFENEFCEFPKGVSFITNYVLVPLMFGYMAILYVYFLKIIVQWELPRGNLGWMISVFGTIGIITKLLMYPMREQRTFLLVLFDHFYYFALIVPVLLLAIAIGVRILAYGVTEPRYIVALLGIWFAVMIVANVVKKERFHIKHVPMVLALMTLLASFGPWSATELSISSQLSRFKFLLEKHQLLVDDKAVQASSEVPYVDRKSLSSMADYLTENEHRLHSIRPWFDSLLVDNKNVNIVPNSYLGGKPIMKLLGLRYVGNWENVPDPNKGVFHFNLKEGFIDVSGFDFIKKGLIYGCSGHFVSAQAEYTLPYKDLVEKFTVACNETTVTVGTGRGQELKFEIKPVVVKLRAQMNSEIPSTEQNKVTLIQSSQGGKLKVGLVLEQIYGEVKRDKDIKLNSLTYTLMVKFNG